MMDDYTPGDVRRGNVELVHKELKDIANARRVSLRLVAFHLTPMPANR